MCLDNVCKDSRRLCERNNLYYHLKTCQRKVAQSSILQNCVMHWEAINVNLVVQNDGLGVLDVAEGGH